MFNAQKYEEFLSALRVHLCELNLELAKLDREDIDTWHEAEELAGDIHFYEKVLAYFSKEDKHIAFESEEAMYHYVETTRNAYKALVEYSYVICTEDGSLVGVSQKEFEVIEIEKTYMGLRLEAWSTFADYCKVGVIA